VEPARPEPQSESHLRPALKKLTRDISGPSIKSVMNGGQVEEEKVSHREQHELYTRQELYEDFSQHELDIKWKFFLDTLDDRPNLKSTLSNEPQLRDDKSILLRIDNHVQDELVKGIKPQLVSWLRRELKNSSIDLITEVREEDVQKFAYTDGEKFEEMLRKNPELAILKQRFNLDFDH
jgi:hypothetical protein